jgi:hypothetical protein
VVPSLVDLRARGGLLLLLLGRHGRRSGGLLFLHKQRVGNVTAMLVWRLRHIEVSDAADVIAENHFGALRIPVKRVPCDTYRRNRSAPNDFAPPRKSNCKCSWHSKLPRHPSWCPSSRPSCPRRAPPWPLPLHTRNRIQQCEERLARQQNSCVP